VGDAARFANWLTNGQPLAPEGIGTTETGSYALNGAVDDANIVKVKRSAGAKYVLPTVNEWYKAAYYKGARPMPVIGSTRQKATPLRATSFPLPGRTMPTSS